MAADIKLELDLARMVKEDKAGKEAEDFARLLFDVAGMTSGYDIEDMGGFAKRVMTLMSPNASATTDAVVESEDKPTETEEKKDDDDGEKAVVPEVVE